jgi:hypothetical protein
MQLEASSSSGRAGAVGMLQAILQAMLQGAAPVCYCPKALKGIVSAGCFTCRMFCSWSSFLDPCLWTFLFLDVLFLDPRSSFLGVLFLSVLVLDPDSWCSRPLCGRHLLVPVTGHKARCLRMFQGKVLYRGRGGGGLRIYF